MYDCWVGVRWGGLRFYVTGAGESLVQFTVQQTKIAIQSGKSIRVAFESYGYIWLLLSHG